MKIERPTDKRLKGQIQERITIWWVLFLGTLTTLICFTYKEDIRLLIFVGFLFVLMVLTNVLEILDKIRLEIRVV